MKVSTFFAILIISTNSMANIFTDFLGSYYPVSPVTSAIDERDNLPQCKFKDVLNVSQVQIKKDFRGDHHLWLTAKDGSEVSHILEGTNLDINYRKAFVYGQSNSWAEYYHNYFIPDSAKPKERIRIRIENLKDVYRMVISEIYFKSYITVSSNCHYELELQKN